MGSWGTACVRTTRHPYATTYRPRPTRRSKPSRNILAHVSLKDLSARKNTRSSVAVSPSGLTGCSRSNARMRCRAAFLPQLAGAFTRHEDLTVPLCSLQEMADIVCIVRVRFAPWVSCTAQADYLPQWASSCWYRS